MRKNWPGCNPALFRQMEELLDLRDHFFPQPSH
jgi:hypothetical protein